MQFPKFPEDYCDFWFCFVLAECSVGLMHTADFMLPIKTVHFSSVEHIKSTGKFRITDRIAGLEETGPLSLTSNHTTVFFQQGFTCQRALVIQCVVLAFKKCSHSWMGEAHR